MDAFIAEIITALPGAIATAIVTVLLSGIVLFLFQEKIKNSFAKSLFEHQTKFSAIHPKRVETLETLYQKCTQCAHEIWLVYRDIPDIYQNRSKIDFSKYEALGPQFDDATSYFLNNRLFLTPSISDEIGGMFRDFDDFRLLIEILTNKRSALSPDDLEFVKKLMKTLHLEILIDRFIRERYFASEPSLEALLVNCLKQLMDRWVKHTARIKQIYVSVADIQYRNN